MVLSASAAITPNSTDDTWYASVVDNTGWNADIGCSLDQYSYCLRNCTSYTAARLVSAGVPLNSVRGLGNGGNWYANAQNRGISVGSVPAVGAAAVIPSTGSSDPGHVAYVTAVNPNGTINVMSYNGLSEVPYQESNTNRYSHFVYFSSSSPIVSAVTAISSQTITPNGLQQVIAGTSSGKVYLVSWGNGAQLTQWQVANLGVQITSISSQLDNGVHHVYAGTSNGTIHHISWGNGNPVTSWQIGNAGSAVNAISSQRVNGVNHVYLGAANGTLHEIVWGNGTPHSGWQVASMGAGITSLSSRLTSGVSHVYLGTANGTAHEIAWGGGSPYSSWQIGATGSAITSVSSQIVNGVDHVYVSAVNGSVHEIAWGNGTPHAGWQIAQL